MSNKITASIHFSFKGEKHSPSIELDIDVHMHASGCLPNLYPLIAKHNDFDMYSYEYEMMQAEEILFSQANGLIAEFIEQGKLDQSAFEVAWHEAMIFNELQAIAKKHLNIENLQQDKNLHTALLSAYKLGQKKPTR